MESQWGILTPLSNHGTWWWCIILLQVRLQLHSYYPQITPQPLYALRWDVARCLCSTTSGQNIRPGIVIKVYKNCKLSLFYLMELLKLQMIFTALLYFSLFLRYWGVIGMYPRCSNSYDAFWYFRNEYLYDYWANSRGTSLVNVSHDIKRPQTQTTFAMLSLRIWTAIIHLLPQRSVVWRFIVNVNDILLDE